MLKNLIPNVSNQKNYRKAKSILTDELIEHQSYAFVSLVGYVIVGLIFFDYIHLLIPPQLFNPNWEIETIGRIIETIWILLLGFMLIFFRTQQRSIKLGELRILSFLSWATLIIAIACFLAAPLLISNAIRINQANKAQINAQLTSQNTRVEKVFTQINQASEQELSAVLKNNQNQSSLDSTKEIKQQLIDVIQQKKHTASEQLNQSLRSKQVKLFKTTFKWVLGAIISGIAFVTVWRYTSWARNIKM